MFLPRKENIMVTDYDKKLTEYWKNWKPGMGPYKGNKPPEKPKKQEVKVNVKVDNLAEDIVDRLWDIIQRIELKQYIWYDII